MTGLTSSCSSTRSPIITSMPPVPFVIAIQPPKPNGVGVLTSATVTVTSFRGMLTFRTLSLKSPCRPSAVSTCWYGAGTSCARPNDDDASTSAAIMRRFMDTLQSVQVSRRFLSAFSGGHTSGSLLWTTCP